MSDGFTKFKKGIQLDPQSADPSNPAEGDFFYSDGTPRDEGLHVYKDGAWVKIPLGAVAPSFTVVSKSANATLATTGEDIVTVDSTAGDITLTLPAASGNSGLRYSIIKEVAANTVTIDGNSTETINGKTTVDLESQYDAIQIVCDGTEWWIENDNILVAATYTSDAGQAISNSTATVIVFEDLVYDTHSGMNTSTGVYTIPVDGKYQINSQVALTGLTADTGNLASAIRKNGTDICVNDDSINRSSNQGANNSIIYDFVVGDTVDVIVFHTNGATRNLITSPPRVNISIARLK